MHFSLGFAPKRIKLFNSWQLLELRSQLMFSMLWQILVFHLGRERSGLAILAAQLKETSTFSPLFEAWEKKAKIIFFCLDFHCALLKALTRWEGDKKQGRRVKWSHRGERCWFRHVDAPPADLLAGLRRFHLHFLYSPVDSSCIKHGI